MEFKKIIPILIIVCIIIGATIIYSTQNTTNTTITNNTTNNTLNNTLNTTNITNNTNEENTHAESSESQSTDSKSYVEKWDESQKGDGEWAYTHDQPVKKGDDGKKYKRVYDEDSGKSHWQSMDSKDYSK